MRLSVVFLLLALITTACLGQPTATPTNTAAPPTATAAPTATQKLAPSLNPAVEISNEDIVGGAPISDVILFTSLATFPLNGVATAGSYPPKGDGPYLFNKPQLWMISPDGTRTGRLTVEQLGVVIYADPSSNQRPIMAAYLLPIETDVFRFFGLPTECYDALPCENFVFGLNGNVVVFEFGPDSCGRGIMALSTKTGKELYRVDGGGHGFGFLPDGRLLIQAGHCEGGWITLVDLTTAEAKQLGAEGDVWFSTDRQSIVVATHPYLGWGEDIWGYNFKSNISFASVEGESNHVVWAPDGKTVLYQRRSRMYDKTSFSYLFGPREIWSIDTESGKSVPMIEDPITDYHLCSAWNVSCEWKGDWVLVRRVPFRLSGKPLTAEVDWYDPVITCFVYGLDCVDEIELYGLNWRTGELMEWDELLPAPTPTVVPTPKPTATPIPGPDLSRTPVYSDPSGSHAFYVGRDGHSLWMVPGNGEPQLWVTDGDNFTYIP